MPPPLQTLCAVVALFCAGLSCVPSGYDQKAEKEMLPGTSRNDRDRYRQHLVTNVIEGGMRIPLTAENERLWEGAFWGMGLARYRSDRTTAGLQEAWKSFAERSPSFRRSMLEAVYALYPQEYAEEIRAFASTTDDPKLFAMCAEYLLRRDRLTFTPLIQHSLSTRFGSASGHPIIRVLSRTLQAADQERPQPVPPLADLFAHEFQAGVPVLFSVQRPDRRYPGLLVVRDHSGRFLRSDDGDYFSIPQLALATSNLPGYLTNGNTPEGVFSFIGLAAVDNVFIGRTETLQLVLPVEADPALYFHNLPGAPDEWTREVYASLLPSSWRAYDPIYEAYDAGAAGRTEIIAHGTTIDPAYYAGEPFSPNTPSLGCLTALEVWDEEDGGLVRSDQQVLVDALRKARCERGYLVVVNAADEPRPVTRADLDEALRAAESRSRR